MKQKFLLKTMLLLSALVVGSGSVWATVYEELFTIKSSDVVTNQSYAAYNTTVSSRDFVITFGGNNKSVGTNSGNRSKCDLSSYSKYAVSPVTTSSVASAFACKTSISDVSKISYTISGGSNQSSTNVYLLYSSDNSTFSQISLTSGTQGATISSGTAYEFSAKTGYFALLFVATNSSGAWRIDDVDVTFYKNSSKVSTPQFYPASGAVASGTEVTITCATDGAAIYYTIDGSTPTSSSTAYDSASKPTITAATTLKAIAVKDGLTDSDVATASYTIAEPCETPEFSEPAGELEIGTSVEISCDTDGATIYYTTDGTNPTTSSTVYSSALTINTAQTIKAIAAKDGMANSAVASISYTVHDYTSLPFIWYGGISGDLTDQTGVIGNSLGDYAAANAPYRTQFNADGDYIQIKTDAQPSRVYIGVKMIGGKETSTITVKASADGSSFDTGQELTISGSQNDIVNLVTTRSFASTDRYIRLVFTKGSNVGVGPISVIAGSTVPATLNASGYATFASGFPLDFSDDSEFSAWQITAANSSTGVITFSQITGVVPSCTGVLLKKEGASSNNINIPVAGSGSFDVSSNLLKGITYPTTVTASQYYGLKGENFVPVAASTTVPAGKALLPVSAVGSDVKAFNFVFEDDADGISLTPALSEGEGAIYNLAGQRVEKPNKGLYIVNGKKVLF